MVHLTAAAKMILPAAFRFLLVDLAEWYLAELRDECAWERKPGVFGHNKGEKAWNAFVDWAKDLPGGLGDQGDCIINGDYGIVWHL